MFNFQHAEEQQMRMWANAFSCAWRAFIVYGCACDSQCSLFFAPSSLALALYLFKIVWALQYRNNTADERDSENETKKGKNTILKTFFSFVSPICLYVRCENTGHHCSHTIPKFKVLSMKINGTFNQFWHTTTDIKVAFSPQQGPSFIFFLLFQTKYPHSKSFLRHYKLVRRHKTTLMTAIKYEMNVTKRERKDEN